jgi:hypothetical protein
MGRPTISDEPLSAKERRERSEKAKLERGERKLSNVWIKQEAADALAALSDGDDSRGQIRTVIENALVNELARVTKESKKKKKG